MSNVTSHHSPLWQYSTAWINLINAIWHYILGSEYGIKWLTFLVWHYSWVFRVCHSGKELSKSWKGIKFSSVVQKFRPFYWRGEFCLLVKLQRGRVCACSLGSRLVSTYLIKIFFTWVFVCRISVDGKSWMLNSFLKIGWNRLEYAWISLNRLE